MEEWGRARDVDLTDHAANSLCFSLFFLFLDRIATGVNADSSDEQPPSPTRHGRSYASGLPTDSRRCDPSIVAAIRGEAFKSQPSGGMATALALFAILAGAPNQGWALAPPPPPTTTPPVADEAVPDAAWNAMVGRDVILHKRDGSEVRGELAGVDGISATVMKEDGRLVVVPRADVIEL